MDVTKNKTEILKDILQLAKAELNKDGNLGYTMPDGKHHIYMYVDDSVQYAADHTGPKDYYYVIEPNRVVDGAHEPMGDTMAADYNDFAELLIGCMWCMDQFDYDREQQRIAEENSTKKNTEIEYLYRDADNYKVWNTCVVEGKLTEEQQAIIWSCLDGEEYFIPSQVGLPERRFDKYDEEVDHPWFELCEFKETAAAPTVNLKAETLFNAFLKAKDHWQENTELAQVSTQDKLPLSQQIQTANALAAAVETPVNSKTADLKR